MEPPISSQKIAALAVSSGISAPPRLCEVLQMAHQKPRSLRE